MNRFPLHSRCGWSALCVLAATYPPLLVIFFRARFPFHHDEVTAPNHFYLFVGLSSLCFVATVTLALGSIARWERLRWVAVLCAVLALLPLNFWLPRLWMVHHP